MAFDFVAYVGRYTDLRHQGGGDFWGKCPFPDHQDKTPSFHLDQKTGRFYCFGCARGGYPPSFVAEMNDTTYSEAYSYLRGKGWEPEAEEGTPTVEEVRIVGMKRELAHWSDKLKTATKQVAVLKKEPEETFDWDAYANCLADVEASERIIEDLESQICEKIYQSKRT